jgi:hypothetical protein
MVTLESWNPPVFMAEVTGIGARAELDGSKKDYSISTRKRTSKSVP